MSKLKIMTVYGTRPEAIKVAPVIKALEAAEDFESIAIVSGQHKEMLNQVNSIFGIEPVENLHVMSERQTLNDILSRVIAGINDVYERYAPDAVIIQGDTSTAMGAAIAAFNRKIPVIHVEAGLRSGDINSPFPEEANRRIISQIASLHLAPTKRTQKNLLREGYDPDTVVVTGNTVIDALLGALEADAPVTDERLQQVIEDDRKIVLVTTHRRENLGKVIEKIGKAVGILAEKYPELQFIVPLHMNPAVRETITPYLNHENILTCDPIAYGDFAQLMKRTFLVLTDSGGIQEEAPSLSIPVLVMRTNTERQEGVKSGTLKLVGTKKKRIVHEASLLIESPSAYQKMAGAKNPYGDGTASEQILDAIREMFNRED